MHTVVVVDAEGAPLRVVCGIATASTIIAARKRSRHNPRNGTVARQGLSNGVHPRIGRHFPVSDRERTSTCQMHASEVNTADLEGLLRRIIREEAGVSPVARRQMARRHAGLRPGTPGLQEKSG
jgi:hypothetical protein